MSRSFMRLKWRRLWCGPARVLDVSESAGTARVQVWGNSDDQILDHDIGYFRLEELPLLCRHAGAQMWYVDVPGEFHELIPRDACARAFRPNTHNRQEHCVVKQRDLVVNL